MINPTNPLFGSLPPTSWQPQPLGSVTPQQAPPLNSSAWFASVNASAQVLSIQMPGTNVHALSNTDVDAWAEQLMNHLLHPSNASS
jgi:hypothetical protein